MTAIESDVILPLESNVGKIAWDSNGTSVS
jgi:hypothetical protein